MIRLVWDQGFKRRYKKRVKNNSELRTKFWEAIDIFIQEPFNPRLRAHKLTGKLSGLWAFGIDYDYRVIVKFLKDNEVLLVDIGTHDEVY